jgi:formylglycine-generating enzyme required for sulfatase activity
MKPQTRIFLSYRREDSRHQVGRLYDRLSARFGASDVFKDVDSIPFGLDFRKVLTERVAECDVLIVVIGDKWLSVTGKSGSPRLDDPDDFVRIEVEAALSRNIPVIPVLVGDSSVPRAEELPESLREMAYRNGLHVRPDPDFRHDVERLIHGIEDTVSTLRKTPIPRSQGRWPQWPLLVAAAVFGILLLLGVIIYLATDKGRIKIVVNDPKAAVKVDGEAVRIEAPGAPITLRAGTHELEVKWGDGEFKTRTFVVHRGDNEDLRVEYEPTRNRKLQAPPGPVPASAPEAPKVITNTIGMKLVLIPAGEFLMGSPDTDKHASADEKPQHRVRITRPFYLGVMEVTRGQYRVITGENPSHFEGSDDLPVERVSLNDTIAFCNKLSEHELLKPYYQSGGRAQPDGDGYRLPTEAEWEYACRAGTTTRFSFGDTGTDLGDHAWFTANSGSKTHPVGQKRPNAWGLYDMHGNVGERCWDGYDGKYYADSPSADPVGLAGAEYQVARGGSWLSDPQGCRAALRYAYSPGTRDNYLGFRVARFWSRP